MRSGFRVRVRFFLRGLITGVAASGVVLATLSRAIAAPAPQAEDYLHVPMPPGFRVESSLLDGPVFADAHGRTLYRWEAQPPGKAGSPVCDSHRYERVTGSAARGDEDSAALILPDADTRPSCVAVWPPVSATAAARPVGDWSIVIRPDGGRQWAYLGYPLYTSVLDKAPGEVHGGTNRIPAYAWMGGRQGQTDRTPVGPPPHVPPGFEVATTALGRLLTNNQQMSVYVSDGDSRGKSHCYGDCTLSWAPLIAPALAQVHGDWSMIERGAGVKQWAFKGRPLYTYRPERHHRGLDGADVAGWQPVMLATMPALPPSVTVQETSIGPVLADHAGKTVYIYNCMEHTNDLLSCDHPGTSQAYRYSLCGNGDPGVCRKMWPYVLATKSDKSVSWVWSVITIDPKTGHIGADRPDVLRVWAFRGRPIYTFSGDKRPGDTFGDGRENSVGGFATLKLRYDLFQSFGED